MSTLEILKCIYACPAIQSVIQTFEEEDPKVIKIKATYQIAGRTFIFASGLVLSLAILNLQGMELGQQMPWLESPIYHLALAMLSLLTICFAVYLEYFDHRREDWLKGRFLTESIRQWYGQLFLDGTLMDLLKAPAHESLTLDQFQPELQRCWERFYADIVVDPIAQLESFMDSGLITWHHKQSSPTNPAIQHLVYHNYEVIRFQTQASYFDSKARTYRELDQRTKAFANTFFFLALTASFTEAGYYLLNHEFLAWSAGAALLFALLSLLVRIYRSALGIPELCENFQSKWVAVVALQTAFKVASDDAVKLDLMKSLEHLATEELRTFLHIVRKSNFSF